MWERCHYCFQKHPILPRLNYYQTNCQYICWQIDCYDDGHEIWCFMDFTNKEKPTFQIGFLADNIHLPALEKESHRFVSLTPTMKVYEDFAIRSVQPTLDLPSETFHPFIGCTILTPCCYWMEPFDSTDLKKDIEYAEKDYATFFDPWEDLAKTYANAVTNWYCQEKLGNFFKNL